MKTKVEKKIGGITFTVKPHADCMGYSVRTAGIAPPMMRHISRRRLSTIRCYYPLHISNDRHGPRQQLRFVMHWYRMKGWV